MTATRLSKKSLMAALGRLESPQMAALITEILSSRPDVVAKLADKIGKNGKIFESTDPEHIKEGIRLVLGQFYNPPVGNLAAVFRHNEKGELQLLMARQKGTGNLTIPGGHFSPLLPDQVKGTLAETAVHQLADIIHTAMAASDEVTFFSRDPNLFLSMVRELYEETGIYLQLQGIPAELKTHLDETIEVKKDHYSTGKYQVIGQPLNIDATGQSGTEYHSINTGFGIVLTDKCQNMPNLKPGDDVESLEWVDISSLMFCERDTVSKIASAIGHGKKSNMDKFRFMSETEYGEDKVVLAMLEAYENEFHIKTRCAGKEIDLGTISEIALEAKAIEKTFSLKKPLIPDRPKGPVTGKEMADYHKEVKAFAIKLRKHEIKAGSETLGAISMLAGKGINITVNTDLLVKMRDDLIKALRETTALNHAHSPNNNRH